MRVNEKIERITPDTLICGIDIGKTKCCARFCDYRGMEVYRKVWFDKTENLDAIGCHITAARHLENKADVIIAFEPTGHYWLNIDKYFPEVEKVYKIDSVGIKPIYDNQLLPNEIKNMTLEKFTELMTKENGRANKKSIMKLKNV